MQDEEMCKLRDPTFQGRVLEFDFTSPGILIQSNIEKVIKNDNDPLIYINSSVMSDKALKSCLHLKHKQSNDDRVMFFDLDNTLYSINTGIAEEMGHRIKLYFQHFLHLPEEEAMRLGCQYYLDYGLAIKGLIRNFQIDPLEYDSFVDGGLELEKVLQKDIELKDMLEKITARKWIFTNAGLKHALRVISLLGIQECFEGIIYCDYGEPEFPAKPDRLAYERAMLCAGVDDPRKCYFVDDSRSNVRTATELGWTAVLIDERQELSQNLPTQQQTFLEIHNLKELKAKLPKLFCK